MYKRRVFIQCGLYSGFPTILNSLSLANDKFAEQGITVPDAELPELDAEGLIMLGRATMQKLHGERAERGYAAPENATTAALYPTAIAYGYGDLWNRPGLDHRQRMICAVAAFTAIDLLPQLEKFAGSALNTGLTREEIIEVIMQTAPYSGFPSALNALSAFDNAIG